MPDVPRPPLPLRLSPRASLCAALAVAVTSHARSRAPRAKSRRAFRYAAGAAGAAGRRRGPRRGQARPPAARSRVCVGRAAGDVGDRGAGLSVAAGEGEKWAGCYGSARYACSIAQLVMGLAEIMGWRNIPDRSDKAAVARFVKAHRKSVQRWLDWLQHAGLVSHTPQQDEEGFWWRTIIELHPAPQLPAELLQEAVERRAGWPSAERRRHARGRRRDLTAILRRARLSRSERARGRCSAVAARAPRRAPAGARRRWPTASRRRAKTHLRHPFGASTTSRTSLEEVSQDETLIEDSRARPHCLRARQRPATANTGHPESRQPGRGRRLAGRSTTRSLPHGLRARDEEWEPFLAAPARRVEELLDWPESVAAVRGGG